MTNIYKSPSERASSRASADCLKMATHIACGGCSTLMHGSLFVAVIKHHDQGHCRKRGCILPYSFRGRADNGKGCRVAGCPSWKLRDRILGYMQEAKTVNWKWARLSTLKPAPARLCPQRLHDFSKQCH